MEGNERNACSTPDDDILLMKIDVNVAAIITLKDL